MATQKQLEAEVAYWQGIWGLCDWDISIETGYVEGGYAQINMDHNRRHAKITIMRESDMPPYANGKKPTISRSICHEILHIIFNIYNYDSKHCEEQAINQVMDGAHYLRFGE